MSAALEQLTSDPLTLARFWSKVRVGRPTQCWEWQEQSRNEHGYGVFNPGRGWGLVKAHRFAFVAANGEIGCDTKVRHSCDNPPCCNPAHLAAGTQAENVADMHARGRRKYASRLSDDQVRDIIQRCQRGEKVSNVARHYGVSASYVSLISNKKRRATRLEKE